MPALVITSLGLSKGQAIRSLGDTR
jgi:hypothetical protein